MAIKQQKIATLE
jgi:hypothetical protein